MRKERPKYSAITESVWESIVNDSAGCDKEFDLKLCMIKHVAAKAREARGLEYGLCAYCPEILRAKGERKMPSEQGIETLACEDCGKPMPPTRNRKTMRCRACQARINVVGARRAKQRAAEIVVAAHVAQATQKNDAPATQEPAAKKITESEIMERAIKENGAQRQLAKAAEEFAEAAAAINRYMNDDGTYGQMLEEIADAEIMCKQIRKMFDSELIDAWQKIKLARLALKLGIDGNPHSD